MTTAQSFLAEQHLWLVAKGFDDRGLDRKGALAEFMTELSRNLDVARQQSGRHEWKQDMNGVFHYGRYPLNFSFHYSVHAHQGEFSLVKVTGSFPLQADQEYRLQTGRLAEVPTAIDIANRLIVGFVQQTRRAYQAKTRQLQKKNRSPK